MNDNGWGKEVLGSGWNFPIKVNNRGGLSISQHEDNIEQSIIIILKTAKGERLMHPEFGCSINELVFAPNNTSTSVLIARSVEEALRWWEPRIDVLNVSVTSDSEDSALLYVDIRYRVKATNDERNLVYPFYLSG